MYLVYQKSNYSSGDRGRAYTGLRTSFRGGLSRRISARRRCAHFSCAADIVTSRVWKFSFAPFRRSQPPYDRLSLSLSERKTFRVFMIGIRDDTHGDSSRSRRERMKRYSVCLAQHVITTFDGRRRTSAVRQRGNNVRDLRSSSREKDHLARRSRATNHRFPAPGNVTLLTSRTCQFLLFTRRNVRATLDTLTTSRFFCSSSLIKTT